MTLLDDIRKRSKYDEERRKLGIGNNNSGVSKYAKEREEIYNRNMTTLDRLRSAAPTDRPATTMLGMGFGNPKQEKEQPTSGYQTSAIEDILAGKKRNETYNTPNDSVISSIINKQDPRPIKQENISNNPKQETELSRGQQLFRGTANVLDGVTMSRFLGGSGLARTINNKLGNEWTDKALSNDVNGQIKAADFATDLLSPTLPMGGAYKAADKGLDLTRALMKPKASQLELGAKFGKGGELSKRSFSETAGIGGMAGLGYNVGENAVSSLGPGGDPRSLKERGLNTALEAGLGAGGDVAIRGIGKLLSPKLKSLSDSFDKGEINQSQFDEAINIDPQLKKEILALPEGQKQLPEPIQRTIKKNKFDYNKNVDVPEGLRLPEGKAQTSIPARKGDYASKLDTLMSEAKKLEYPPGREREALESTWSQMAQPNDPSLDELIKRGTPSLKSINLKGSNPSDILKQARTTQSKSAYGLDTTFNKLKQTKGFESSNNLGNPLPFKREAYNIPTTEKLPPQSFVGQSNQLSKTKVQYNKPKVDDNLLNSLEYGDKVKVRSGRGEVELSFVKREGDQVVVKRKSGKETVVPASMVNGKVQSKVKAETAATVDTLKPKFESITPQKKTLKPKFEAPLPKMKPVNSLVNKNDLPKAQAKSVTEPLKSLASEHKGDLTKLKDISGFKGATNDIYRNFRDVFGKSNSFKSIKKNVLEPLEQSKAEYVEMQKDWTDKLKTDIVDGLGIKKGSKESALVQQYGEKEISLKELKKKAPDKWLDIVDADVWFRKTYDEIIDTINASRAKIYPNNPDKIVPKRDDYYRHFNELGGITGLKNIFDTPGAIDPHLAGTSQFTKPKGKFQGFMQKRGVGPFKRDAVGGFLEYIPAASYATKIDANIPRLREFKNQLADATVDSKNMNNFIEFIDNYANDLSGKTNPYFDRNIQSLIPGGRKTFAALGWLNNRVKSNVILGNVSSSLAQIANVPNGIAFAKIHSVNGFKRTVKTLFDKNTPMQQSEFLKERYSQELYRRFDEKLIQQPKKLAEWTIETADRVGTSFIWNASYEKAIKEKIKNPIKYADENTRRLVAGRGIGEVPLLQKSKAVQLAMPFTLEVGNAWRVMGDMAKGKDVTGFMTLFVANFILNKGIKEIRGFDATFDPIQATIDALSEEDITPLERVGRVAGEALTNLPSGQFVANLYPEYGKVAGIQGPTRKELFGENNPQRFGTGLVAADGITDPFKSIPSFGGNQLKKTLGGLDVLSKDAAFKKGKLDVPFLGDYKEMKYPVKNNLENKLKGTLFGSSALDETREYYDNKRRPLSEDQTNTYKRAEEAGKSEYYYKKLMKDREIRTLKGKITSVKKDSTLTNEEKKEQIMKLTEELKRVAKGDE